MTDEIVAILIGAVCFLLGMVVSPRKPADPSEIEALVRRHLANQIREYAQHSDQVKLRDLMRIVEGRGL